MDSKETGQNMDPKNSGEKAKDQDFNAGGNASDYDGGHPKDVYSDSEGRIDSGEDRLNNEKSGENREKDDSFNAGGNDSDYDGGHPKDASADSPGHIDSTPDKPGNT